MSNNQIPGQICVYDQSSLAAGAMLLVEKLQMIKKGLECLIKFH